MGICKMIMETLFYSGPAKICKIGSSFPTMV